MKNKIILMMALCAALTCCMPRARAQALHQGNFTVDAYYGFPNLMTGLFKIIAQDNTTDPNLKVTGLGPFGARAQYLVSDHFGIGVDFYFASSTFSYTDVNYDTSGVLTTYHYKLNNPRPRFLLRMDYHIGNNDVVDPYVAVGLGYNASSYKFTTDDPNFDINTYTTRNLIPVAFRTAFGVKFYFAQFMGAGIEVGLGGPLVTVGLTGKF